MKTQISRDSFRREQRYSGVYLQQGRMILDADWNELVQIDTSRLIDALRDAVAGGAPRLGGLQIYADPPASTTLRIRPGVLYVDGVAARIDGAAPLAIDAQPDYPLKASFGGAKLRLYADLWERSVGALEAPALMDPALHGADTATRSQTMLQVKWCADSIDPLDAAANPAIGDAPLLLRLRLIESSGDACDPCASQVRVDERIGNYLFRVEVHDYDPATQWLTLKWSRDNGAEACAVAAMPAGFDQGDWVWEYYDGDTERLLGNHFVGAPATLRGLIRESCVAPTGDNEPKTWVRQWDGYLRIKLDSGAHNGRDRGAALFAGAVGNSAHGRVSYSGGVLKVNLERVELELRAGGRRFVAGDYWQATVREAVQRSGQYLLPAMDDLSMPAQGEPPRGVRHHYLLLGEVDGQRQLVAGSDAFRRRMAFPPLSDIRADDVAFTDRCAGLFAGAQNVQQALDNLCAIGAEDIAYALPDCAGQAGRSIRDRLKALLDPDNDGRLSVKAALDALLCQLDAASLPYGVPACAATPSVGQLLALAPGDGNVAPVLDRLLCDLSARHLPLDKSDGALCNDLKVPAVVSVQDALGVLCARPSGGCAVAASSPQHLGALLDEFARSPTASELWICLKAGSYPLAALPPIAGKRSLRISGEAAGSVAIAFAGATLALGADQLILENLALSFANSAGQMAISALTASVHGCLFSRTTASADGPPMLRVVAPGNARCRLDWRDNRLSAQRRTATGVSEPWAGVGVVGNAKVSDALLALARDDALVNKTAYDVALRRAVTSILAMTAQERARWRVNLEKAIVDNPHPLAVRAVKADARRMVEALAADQPSAAETVAAVESLVALWVSYAPDYALCLANAKVGGLIEDCEVDGWLLLGNGIGGSSPPGSAGQGGVAVEGEVVRPGGEELHLRGNSLTAIRCNVPKSAFNADGALIERVAGHARLFLIGNSIADPANSLVAGMLIAQGNSWAYDAASPLGLAIADRATFTGNLLEGYTDNAGVACTARAAMIANAGNLLVDLVSTR